MYYVLKTGMLKIAAATVRSFRLRDERFFINYRYRFRKDDEVV